MVSGFDALSSARATSMFALSVSGFERALLANAFCLEAAQFLYRQRLNSGASLLAQTVTVARFPKGVFLYPTIPATTMLGQSSRVTGSITSFCWRGDPARPSTFRKTWVMPAFHPTKAVKWQSSAALSSGKALILPRDRLARFRGRKA